MHSPRYRSHCFAARLLVILAAAPLVPTPRIAGCSDVFAVAPEQLRALALAAVESDAAVARDAVAQLRAAGQPGVDALMGRHASTILAMRSGALRLNDPPAAAVRRALDAVAGQRDAFAAGLFWHTSLDAAQRAARATMRPMLSLRLMGNLDEELSCANSRFFRTTLYANAEIAKLLRERFVLHWQSVRPVPRITVHFGDGRKMERTITGNSIHYVLDPDGLVIEALPGLFAAQTFARALRRAADIAQKSAALPADARPDFYARTHQEALGALEERWSADLAQLRIEPLTFTIVRHGLAEVADAGRVDHENELWQKIATLHHNEARLDPASRALLQAKNPSAEEAGRRALAKHVVESPLMRALRNLETSIAADSVRNEFSLHARLHEWLTHPETARDVDALNRRVYAELFLTPESDPWLGLAPAETHSALDRNGLHPAGSAP